MEEKDISSNKFHILLLELSLDEDCIQRFFQSVQTIQKDGTYVYPTLLELLSFCGIEFRYQSPINDQCNGDMVTNLVPSPPEEGKYDQLTTMDIHALQNALPNEILKNFGYEIHWLPKTDDQQKSEVTTSPFINVFMSGLVDIDREGERERERNRVCISLNVAANVYLWSN